VGEKKKRGGKRPEISSKQGRKRGDGPERNYSGGALGEGGEGKKIPTYQVHASVRKRTKKFL